MTINNPLKLVKCFNDLGVKNVNHAKINKIRHEEIIIENVKFIFYLFNCIFLNIKAKYECKFYKINTSYITTAYIVKI